MQRRVPFGPEISWPTGYYDLQYQDGDYRYPGQPPATQGEHPYASYGDTGYGGTAPSRPGVPDSGYGDPGYLDPGYQGPASEDAGFAAPGYGSPSRQGPGYQGPRQQNSYQPDSYPSHGYQDDGYPPGGFPPGDYRPDAYPGGAQGSGYPDAGYSGGGYPAPDPRDPAGSWAGANFGTGAQELRDYQDFDGPDQRGSAPGYGGPPPGGPGYPDSGYDEGPGYGHPGYDGPGYGGEYDGSRYGDGQYGEPGMDEPGYGRLSYDDPRYDQPGWDGPGPGAAGYDDPGYGDRPGYGGHSGYDGQAGYENGGFGGAGYGGPGGHDAPFAPGYDDPRYDPRYNDARRGDPRFQGARFDDTRLDNPRVPGDGPRFDDTRLDTPRYQDGHYDDAGYDAGRPALPPAGGAGMLAAPTGLLARPDTGQEPWAGERDVFSETMLDEIPALTTEQELAGTGQFDTSRLEAGQFDESAEAARRGRRTGRRRAGSNDRRQWLALGGVVIVAAGAIAGVLKFAFPSHNGGPAHTMATPNQIGPYQRKVNLERQMQVAQLRNDVIKTSAGQASSVVSGVYQAGSTTPGSTAQIFMFIGGHLANASPATSIASFTQKFPGARLVPAGSLGGEAACVEATENQGNVAMCIWFDNDSFGELVSPTMSTTTLANVMRTVRPSLELTAPK